MNKYCRHRLKHAQQNCCSRDCHRNWVTRFPGTRSWCWMIPAALYLVTWQGAPWPLDMLTQRRLWFCFYGVVSVPACCWTIKLPLQAFAQPQNIQMSHLNFVAKWLRFMNWKALTKDSLNTVFESLKPFPLFFKSTYSFEENIKSAKSVHSVKLK